MIINNNFPLKSFNTFGIDVQAKQCAEIYTDEDLFKLFENKSLLNQPVLIIGQASNILFLSDYEGIVLMNKMKGKKVISETDDEVFLEVAAGESWPELVDFTVKNKWWGIENLSLIPGNVGASPVQNIGAYGVELKDVFFSLEAFDLENGKIVSFSKEECNFKYRNSIFKTEKKGKYLVLRVVLKLSKKSDPNLSYKALSDAFSNTKIKDISLQSVRNKVNEIRESKLPDPKEIKNAGSFFKNPVVENKLLESLTENYPNIPNYKVDQLHTKLAAGWLIEQCGWKGHRTGDAGVHHKQALVLVNYGNASGTDIFSLSENIKKSVLEKFGVELEREVLVI
jgi:UDP-N-acetylmuramate dehydrogenase